MSPKPICITIIGCRKEFTLFRLDKLWVSKHFFHNKETFKASEFYNENKLRFEFKTFGEE